MARTRTRLAPAAADLTLADLEAVEDLWRPATRPDIRVPPSRWPAEPYPLPAFAELLAAAMAAPGMPRHPVFCDIGAGPGTKVLYAAQRGCRAWGLDNIPEYVEAARQLGADVRLALAEAAALDGVHIAFVNCLYRLRAAQQLLEQMVAARLPSSSVLILVNAAAPPPGWAELARHPGPVVGGAWRKP